MNNHTTHPHPVRRWAGTELILLGLAGAFMVGLAWFRATVPRAAWTDPIPHTDVNPYGANFFLDREAETWKQERTLEMAREAGIGWVKQQFSWEMIEPQQGQFTWERFDQIVELARRYGMQVIARLDRTPAWARPGKRFANCPPDDLSLYGDFVHAFVQRYSGRVRYIQVWNEPNLAAEWCFQAVDPAAYTQLLAVAYRRAKEADPNVVVLSAPLAINREEVGMRGNLGDLPYLEQMYRAGAGGYFDILSANGFGLGFPPEEPPHAETLTFRRVEWERDVMKKYGDANKPIWINEYGWNAPPDDFPPELLIWARVTEEEQAEYTTRGIEWARGSWPWLGVVNIWFFRQAGDIPPDRAVYYFGMVQPDFTPRPVYEALRRATKGVGVAQVGLHQETSPAVSAPGWRLVLDPAASAGAVLTAAEGADSLTFTFEGPRVALVAAQGPGQGRLWVELDGAPPSGLPLDGEGHAYVSLAAGRIGERVTFPLAQRLAPGTHQLTLTPNGPVTVDGFEVSAESNPLPFCLLWALCAATIAGGAVIQHTKCERPSTPLRPAQGAPFEMQKGHPRRQGDLHGAGKCGRIPSVRPGGAAGQAPPVYERSRDAA